MISAKVFKENKDSAKLLERLHFTYEGCIRNVLKVTMILFMMIFYFLYLKMKDKMSY